ncbi:FtsZ/tubulin family protein [Ornithinibacillus halophilus]|uniref:Cell division protein FtsZ n=1 Tax=Ornithinibacillus halophilus TaxID=930117 RepID=A0A1M5G4B2_9BACI|nr:cell division protein FtsZ [Ornithinibacillus halophilus]SHF98637.1 cell division protein FtsZ [Ornithinibacillus halophilus]
MGAPVGIYQNTYDTDKPLEEKLNSDNLHFYRFIGGNASETEELVTNLSNLKEKKTLLIGLFRFPFRFEGKKRYQIATTQYFRMKEICDAVIYFNSDRLLETIDSRTSIKDAHQTFNAIEDYTADSLRDIIDNTGEMNIDYRDIETFIKRNSGSLFIHTVEVDSFDEPLKYLISTPYLPEDFTDGKQLIINFGYSKEVDMESFRQMNIRLHDLFSKADIFKIGAYYIDEPGHHFKVTLIVNGMDDPVEEPDDYKKIPKYKELLRKWQFITRKK